MGQYDSDCTFKRSDTRRARRRRLTLIQRGPRHAMTNAVLLRNLPLTGSGRQQQRLSDRIIRTIASGHRRVARSGVRGRAPLRVVSDRARPHARRECISGRRRVPAAGSCGSRLFAQRHWPVAANDAGAGKHGGGWTIVCGYREQCTGGRRGARRISLADRRFCQENRGFLSTTLAAHLWQRRCS